MNQILGQTEEIEIKKQEYNQEDFNKNKNEKEKHKKRTIFEKILIILSILVILGLSMVRNFIIWSLSWI